MARRARRPKAKLTMRGATKRSGTHGRAGQRGGERRGSQARRTAGLGTPGHGREPRAGGEAGRRRERPVGDGLAPGLGRRGWEQTGGPPFPRVNGRRAGRAVSLYSRTPGG
jgi:hypothetical protein